jgi:hypothetical protein
MNGINYQIYQYDAIERQKQAKKQEVAKQIEQETKRRK